MRFVPRNDSDDDDDDDDDEKGTKNKSAANINTLRNQNNKALANVNAKSCRLDRKKR